MIKRALLSLTNKNGLIPFAQGLSMEGFELVSTGNTAKAIRDAGLKCESVETVTGFPEMLDGRVKMLHPAIFGGIMADQRNQGHMEIITQHRIQPFGLVAVNFYDFLTNPGIDSIDIGGPSAIESAAKNYQSVGVVVDPADYEMVLSEIVQSHDLSIDTRFKLAAKAFKVVAQYKNLIAAQMETWLNAGVKPDTQKK